MTSLQHQSKFDLERLYEMYPRKRGKRLGMSKLKQIILTVEDYVRFERALKNYLAEIKRHNTKPHYIKHWTTFVNNWHEYETSEEMETFESQAERIMRGEL